MNAILSSLNIVEPIEAPLAEIIEAVIGRIQTGHAVDVEIIVEANPKYAGQLREILPAVAAMVQLGGMTPNGANAPSACPSPPRGGEIEAWQTADFPSSELNGNALRLADDAPGSSRLAARCPNCHQPTRIAVDTTLTDLTYSACGSHFSLINRSDETCATPSLTTLRR